MMFIPPCRRFSCRRIDIRKIPILTIPNLMKMKRIEKKVAELKTIAEFSKSFVAFSIKDPSKGYLALYTLFWGLLCFIILYSFDSSYWSMICTTIPLISILIVPKSLIGIGRSRIIRFVLVGQGSLVLGLVPNTIHLLNTQNYIAVINVFTVSILYGVVATVVGAVIRSRFIA